LKLNGELRKMDADRWLQAHLETLSLDVSYSDALTKTLGPSSENAIKLIGRAVGGMICRAIRLASEKEDDGLLNAVVPYLNFCKQGKGRDRIMTLWEETVSNVRDRTGNDDFGVVFEGKLMKTSKKRTSNAADAALSPPPNVEKKAKTSELGRKRGIGKLDTSGVGEEEGSPRKTAQPLAMVPKSQSKKKSRSSDAAAGAADEERKQLERNVFESVGEEEVISLKDNKEEEDLMDDIEQEKTPSKSKSTTPTSSSKKKKSSSSAAAVKKSIFPPKTIGSSIKTQSVIEDDQVEDDDDDDDDIRGFRPRHSWTRE